MSEGSQRITAVDTSVAIPLLVASHPVHRAVADWAAGRDLSLAGHALHETYSVLTRLPGDARVRPTDAITLMTENFAAPLLLTEESQRLALPELAQRDVSGGATYDALIALAARAHQAVLATRDERARGTYEVLGLEVEVLRLAVGSDG